MSRVRSSKTNERTTVVDTNSRIVGLKVRNLPAAHPTYVIYDMCAMSL